MTEKKVEAVEQTAMINDLREICDRQNKEGNIKLRKIVDEAVNTMMFGEIQKIIAKQEESFARCESKRKKNEKKFEERKKLWEEKWGEKWNEKRGDELLGEI
jgi:hypothetical protein